MADALLGVVVEKSLSLIRNEFATLSGLRKKVENLSNTLTLIRAVLEDAEKRQMTESAVKVWLQQLKDAAYVLEDILEDCSFESHQLGGLSSFKPKNIMFRCRVGHKLKEMMERLDQIFKAKNDFGLREGVVRERPSEVAEWRETTSNLACPQVHGREEDKEKVVEFLLSPARSSDDFPSVYAIVGLGGLGKTTLAQTIFNDQKVSDHFPLRIWICVSEIFTRKRILCSIIEFLEEKCDASKNLDVMERKVQKLLQSKRYLLVLDDVWKKSQTMESGVSHDEWDTLKSVLSCGSKGTSILVTTRDREVAEIMGACEAHHLSVLSEDDCWSLFKQRAFGPDKEGRAVLVAIGKEIVKKCGGSPLAAKALGGLLHSCSEEKEWREVQESKLWTLPHENGILPALRLSYFHLTPTLKQCFAFCAMFPKDDEIMKQELIHLWMANGFISSRENLAVEEVGNMIWNQLYQKSFFQDVRINDLGVIYFKMHDLVHDLAQSITDQDCIYLEDINLTSLQRNTHHIGFSRGDQKSFNKKARDKVESLRTWLQLKELFWGEFSAGWLPTSLRVLQTSSLKLSLLGNLTHLRYLTLSNLEIKTLPDSIHNLRKLEILKLIHLRRLRRLPKRLTRLQNLRHLVIEDCESLSRIVPDIHRLSHLRTLSVYIVKKEAGHSLTALRDLNLGGQLSIGGLENVSSLSEAEANLKGKEDLRELSLSWKKSDETNSNAIDTQLLEALQPHQNLKALTIHRCKGLHWPSWMRNNLVLNELVSLRLCGCRIRQQLPQLGKLPSLKKLEIIGMEYVQYVDGDECYDGVEVRAFPSLESLEVAGLPMLERLLKVEKDDMFPHLSYLVVSDCPKLQLSFLPCVKNLYVRSSNNELLKSISCLSSLDSLTLYDSEDTSLPEGMMDNLTNLKTLQISGFRRLKELPSKITKLSALESLRIESCDELECFPEQGLEGLRSLRTLEIKCTKLRSLPDGVQHLTSLEALTIRSCDKLECFPDQALEGLRSLRTLEISSCGGLRSLPDGVQHLNSLEALSIWCCNKLECFPDQALEGLRSLRTLEIRWCEGLRSLPDGVQHLTSLEALTIELCPTLQKRCKKGTGKDWHKIQHIPKLTLYP